MPPKTAARASAAPSRALAEHFGYAETTAEDGSMVVKHPGRRVADITDERVLFTRVRPGETLLKPIAAE